ncbi:MAG: hypothetical protein LBT48_00715 [Prevotellaceae bacterium]|jgi:hypothetical protein|nr:hypothetical protein [Prevotellaceae bacterium]
MKRLFFLTVMALVLSVGCTEGEGDTYYDPEFSTTALSFDRQGGTQSITSKYSGWWIDRSVYINDIEYILNPYIDEYSDIDRYIPAETDPRHPSTIIKMKGPWFTVNKGFAQSKEITFELMPNETGKSRTLKLLIQDGTFSTALTATQSAE